MTASIARRVVQSFRVEESNPLSEREKEVLKLLVDGENYRSIAEALFVSTNTVKAHSHEHRHFCCERVLNTQHPQLNRKGFYYAIYT